MRPNFLTITAVFLLLVAGFSGNVTAHQSQPGLLQLTQQDANRHEALWEVLWRAPIYFGKPHPASLQLPSNWKTVRPPTTRQLADSELHRHLVSVDTESIHGSVVRLPGLEATTTDVLLRVVYANGSSSTTIIKPAEPWVTIEGPRSAWRVAWDYTVLGVEHILSGIDHLLFVLALILIVKGMRTLLITVTSFTVAHSITLAAATLGWVWVPGPPVDSGTQHHPGSGNAWMGMGAGPARGSGDCTVYPVPCQRTGESQSWPAKPHRKLSLAGGVHLWPVTWFRICRCAEPGGTTAKRNSTGPADVQCWRGTRSVDVYSGHAGVDQGTA